MKLAPKSFILPILLLLGLGSLIGFVIAVPKLIRIKIISCSDQYGYCSQNISDKLKTFEGKSLGDSTSLIKASLKTNVLISDYSIQYIFPDSLKVNLIVKKPKFALKNKDDEASALITDSGDAVSISNSVNLPALIIEGKIPNVGEKASSKEMFASGVLIDMFYLYRVKTGYLQGDSLIFTLNDGKKVIFPVDGDKDVLIGSLRLIFSRLNGESESLKIDIVKEIDLRFKNPVLR